MDLVDKLKAGYKQGSVFTKLIYINIGIFLVWKLALAILNKFVVMDWSVWLELPSDFQLFIRRPWTLITYMFLHQDFRHIFGNMIMLYFFGKFILEFINEKQALSVYFFGGIGGAALYLLAYNLIQFSYFQYNCYLLGASAACYSLLTAAVAIKPNYSLRLMFIGEVKMKWIAFIFIGIVCFNLLTGDNMGGDIAHLGGFLFGYIYGAAYAKGNDFLKPFVVFVEKIIALFSGKKATSGTKNFARRPQYHFQKGSPIKTDAEYNVEAKQRQQKIDLILDKIKKYGYDSLSQEEKETLFKS